VRQNDRDLAERLLERGADPNGYIDSCGNVLSQTADKSMRLLLYRYGATMDAFGYVWEENVDAVAVAAELDPEKVGRSGCGGAFAAVVSRGDWDLFHLLLRRGVRVPDVVTGCRTYLWRTPAMTRVLLEHGMNPNLPNWLRVTPLHDLCNHDGKGRPDPNRHELLGLFLEFGANLNAVDEEYCSTPLGWAARSGLEDMVTALLDRGADPNLPEDIPWATPLAWAEKRGYAQIAEILRKHGARR
jgi:hypothetical protein